MLDTGSQSLSKGNDVAIADRASLVRNDVTPLVPQYLSALVPSKKAAFTLAEVLITLGIIGVVAALTMPNMIANYKKMYYVTQLKKDVSWVQNSFKKIMADEGVDNIEQTSIGEFENTQERGPVYAIDTAKFGKYFDLQPYNKYVPNENTTMNEYFSAFTTEDGGYMLKDGSCVRVYSVTRASDNSIWQNGHYAYIDINCDKAPNRFGYDRFQFEIDKFGVIGGFAASATVDNVAEIRSICESMQKYAKVDDFESRSVASQYGLAYCSPLVIYDGWKITY